MPLAAAAARQHKKVYDSPIELDLVHRAKLGDEAAFRELYEHHHNRVYVTVKRMLSDDDTSQWVANVALAKVWKALPSFKENSKFSTWVTRIAINEARMHLRSEKRHQRDISLDTWLADGPIRRKQPDLVDPATPQQKLLAVKDLTLEGVADRQVLERAINRVPRQFREILRLKFWEGMSMDEIKVKLRAKEKKEVSISAVKSRILRGRSALIEQVERIS